MGRLPKMKKSRTYKPSPMAIKILTAINAGLPAKHHLRGMAEHGGAEWAIDALRRHGFLCVGGLLTEKGRAFFSPSTEFRLVDQ